MRDTRGTAIFERVLSHITPLYLGLQKIELIS